MTQARRKPGRSQDVVASLRRLGGPQLDELEGLEERLAALGRHLQVAVPSFHGVRVTLVEQRCPIGVTVLSTRSTRGPAQTSLSVPLTALGGRVGGRLTLYAEVRGALVDLAADLAAALRPFTTPRRGIGVGGDSAPPDRCAHREDQGDLVLDGEQPGELTAGVSGLAELARVHQALGWLVERGWDPDHVEEQLHGAAAAAGVSSPDYATTILGPASPHRGGCAGVGFGLL